MFLAYRNDCLRSSKQMSAIASLNDCIPRSVDFSKKRSLVICCLFIFVFCKTTIEGHRRSPVLPNAQSSNRRSLLRRADGINRLVERMPGLPSNPRRHSSSPSSGVRLADERRNASCPSHHRPNKTIKLTRGQHARSVRDGVSDLLRRQGLIGILSEPDAQAQRSLVFIFSFTQIT